MNKRITQETILGLKIPGEPVLSPDGSLAAFVVREADLKESRWLHRIWITDLRSKETRVFTRGKEDTHPRWSPDGQHLAFLRKENTEDSAAQLWVIRSGGGEAWPLTEDDTAVETFDWHPDGQGLVYLSPEGPTKAARERKRRQRKEKLDVTVEGKERYRKVIWRIDLHTKVAQPILRGDYGISELAVSPDGCRIVYSTNYTGKEDDLNRYDLWVVSIEDGSTYQLTSRLGPERHPRWSPDGRVVAFIAPFVPELLWARNDLFVIPASGGEPVNLSAPLDRDVEAFAWDASGRSLYLQVTMGVHTQIFSRSLEDEGFTSLAPEGKVVEGMAVSRDGCVLVALVEDATSYPDLWVLKDDGSPQPPFPVTDLNPHLREYTHGKQETVRWRSTDGTEIEGVLTLPPEGEAERPYPLVVYIHGGPHARTPNCLRRYFNPQVLAARGYAVFAPNPRGSTGYGHAFSDALRGDLGGVDYRDIMSGVDFLTKQGIADPDRLAVLGGSYGGYMTNWIITQTNRFKAAVSLFGIFSLLTDFGNSYAPSWEPYYLKAHYWENLEIYLQRSPGTYATKIQTPVLIIHGEDDPNTFISNSKEMYTALTRLGRTVEFVRYPREKHGLQEPKHRRDEMERVLEWLDRYVRTSIPRQPRETVEVEGNRLQVVSIDLATYVGTKATGRFMELRLWLSTERALSLNLVDELAPDVLIEDAEGQVYTPIGMAVDGAGGRLLLKGRLTLALSPGVQGPNEATVRIAFDLPQDARGLLLRVKGFPPVTLT